MKPVVVNITGPTASGKTALAVELAAALGTEIVSADSRQVYREMRIGTAVPDEEEQKGIRHHLLQHRSIQRPYTVKDYEREALETLSKLFKRYPVVIMAGGTGLYFRAVHSGLDPIPDVPAHIRQHLQRQWEKEGLGPLLEELRTRDPVYYETVDRHNPVRIIRALEVIRHTGKAFSSYRTGKKAERPFRSLWIGLAPPRAALYERINRRVMEMDRSGLEDEVRRLYPFRHLNALQTVGYREWFPYFEGKTSRERVLEEIAKNTRRYAKRQCTWFRRNPDIRFFDPLKGTEVIEVYVKRELDRMLGSG